MCRLPPALYTRRDRTDVYHGPFTNYVPSTHERVEAKHYNNQSDLLIRQSKYVVMFALFVGAWLHKGKGSHYQQSKIYKAWKNIEKSVQKPHVLK